MNSYNPASSTSNYKLSGNAAQAANTVKDLGFGGNSAKNTGYSTNTKSGAPIGTGLSGIGGLADVGSAIVGGNPATSNSTTETLNSAYDTASNAVAAIPGIGTALSAGMKLKGFASDGLNKLTNGATTIENATLGTDKVLSSKFFSLTPVGLTNALTKKTVQGSNDDLANTITSGYTASAGLGKTDIGGVSRFAKKLFTGKDAVKDRRGSVNRINTDNALKSHSLYSNKQNMLASSNSMQDVANKNFSRLKGGYKTNVLAAKKGTKLAITKLASEVREKKEKNVIPSGALHARKHNLPEEIAKHVTHKGIPVISKESGGDIIQHAEIEHSEIIFTKEVTDKLESLLKDFEGGDEQAAIKAGKLLTKEILENTEDNTGLLND